MYGSFCSSYATPLCEHKEMTCIWRVECIDSHHTLTIRNKANQTNHGIGAIDIVSG